MAIIYSREHWEQLAVCIKSEQIPVSEIIQIFDDNPDLEEWYLQNKLEKVSD